MEKKLVHTSSLSDTHHYTVSHLWLNDIHKRQPQVFQEGRLRIRHASRVVIATSHLPVAESVALPIDQLAVVIQRTAPARPILAVRNRIHGVVELDAHEETIAAAVQTLKSDCASHGRDVTCFVDSVGEDVVDRERLLVVEDAGSGCELADLAVVGESTDERAGLEGRGLVVVGVSCVGAVGEALDDGRDEGQHQVAFELCAGSRAVVVTDVLGVFVLEGLFFGEDIAPRRASACDLGLEAAAIQNLGQLHCSRLDIRFPVYQKIVIVA
jgi:hypothetical protein